MMRFALTTALVCGMILSFAAPELSAQRKTDGGIEYQLRRAERLMDQLNFRFAIRHLERVGKNYPKDGRVDVLRGESHFALDQWKEAVAAYRTGLKKTPALGSRLPNYPFALVKLGELDTAEKAYGSIFSEAKSDAERAQGAYGLGLVSLHRGQTDEAIEHLERAYSFNARSSKINYRLGLAYRTAKKPDLALKHLDIVMKRNGLHEAAAYNVAMAWAQKRDRAKVKEWKKRHRDIRQARLRLGGLRAQLVRRQGDPTVLRAIAELQSEFRNFDEAIGPWRAVTAANARDPEVRFQYARCLFHTGSFLESRQQLEQVMGMDPNHAEAKALHQRIMEEFHGGDEPAVPGAEKKGVSNPGGVNGGS